MANVDHQSDRLSTTESGVSRSAVRTRRKGRRILLLFGLTLLAVWFAPPLVAVSPLRDTLLNLAVGDGASIRSGGASLGWFSPIELGDVRLYDRQGELLAVAPSTRVERRLIELAFDPRNVGTVRLERPTVNVALRAGGSNWEDFLAPWLAASDEPARPIAINVEVRDGSAVVVDTVAGRKWEVTLATANFTMSGDEATAIKLVAKATLAGDRAAPDAQVGRLEVTMETGPSAADGPVQGSAGRLTLNVDNLPLAIGESLLARFAPGSALSGDLSSNMTLTWTDTSGQMLATGDGQVTVNDLSLAADVLGDDRLTLARLDVAPVALAWENGRLAIERLTVACDLGQLSVEGALGTEQFSADRRLEMLGAVARENYKIDAEVDLARLAAMLPGVLRVREGTTITAGKLRVSLDSTAGVEGHVWRGRLDTDRLAATSDGRPLVWDRPVHLAWTARDTTAGFKLDELLCRSDFLQLQGAGTLDAITATATYDLDRLAENLDGLIDLGGWRFGGHGHARLALQREPAGAFRANAQLTVEEFQLTHPERLPWTEEQMELGGNIRWDPIANRVDVTDAKLTSMAATVEVDEAAWQAGQNGAAKLSATISYDAAIDQLYRWTVDPKRPAPWWPAGRVAGRARLAHQGGKTEAHIEMAGRDMLLYEHVPEVTDGSPYRLVWREPELTLSADAAFDQATDSLRIDRSQLQTGVANLSASGTISALGTAQQLDVAGTIDYDLEKITALVRPYLGQRVKLIGRDTATFKVRGPLSTARVDLGAPAVVWSRRLAGAAGFAWQRADVYGLPLGPGRLEATLGNGRLRVAPLDLAVLEGRLTLAPTVRFDPGPMEILLPAGPLVENVRITPEVADTALKYIAPVLADATRTEGRFSIGLAAARVPLDKPGQAQVSGHLTIDDVRVTPGPLAQEFIRIGRQIEAIVERRSPSAAGSDSDEELMTIDNQDVAFQMVDGRVYHRSLEVTVGRKVRLRTSGWVGIDQTLAILAEVPIRDEWIRGEPYLEGLRNQSLRIPISGTLSRPRVDARAMARLGEQLLGGAVRGAIQTELNKQLEKLLRRN